MISELTATVRAALDQRLSVARTPGVDPLRPVATDADSPRSEAGNASARATPIAQGKAALEFAARWPVGSTVAARVTATADAGRVIADIDGLPLELHWRGNDGTLPGVGQSLAFRVLALRPEIVLQRLAATTTNATFDGDASTRISHDAQALQASAILADYGAPDERTVRFTTPLVSNRSIEAATVEAAVRDSGAPAPNTTPTASPIEHAVVVPRAAADPSLPFAPVILTGPAWQGQPMELIVRRHRRDERLDDPTQDDWCGELEIDLPRIGRVTGHLAWSMQGLRIRLDADRANSATTLADAAPELAAAFIDVRLRVAALSIGHAIHGASAGDHDDR